MKLEREPPSLPVNPTQRRLVALLEQQPGRSLQEIADHLFVTRTAIVYHVRKLERLGLIFSLQQGNRRLHFPKSISGTVQRTMLGVFRLRNARHVVEALREDPTISWRSMARKLNLAPHTVRWHISRMEDEGLLRVVEQAGRRHVIALHPELQAAVGPAPAGERTAAEREALA